MNHANVNYRHFFSTPGLLQIKSHVIKESREQI